MYCQVNYQQCCCIASQAHYCLEQGGRTRTRFIKNLLIQYFVSRQREACPYTQSKGSHRSVVKFSQAGADVSGLLVCWILHGCGLAWSTGRDSPTGRAYLPLPFRGKCHLDFYGKYHLNMLIVALEGTGKIYQKPS